MATYEARPAMRVRKAIAATLAGGALALIAPAGIAMADPIFGPSGVNDPAINDYIAKVNAAIDQLKENNPSTVDQQQFSQQITAANNELREALRAMIPTIAGR